MAYTSNSEFDAETRVQLTNEIRPLDISEGVHSTLKRDIWKWLLGWVDTTTDITYDMSRQDDPNYNYTDENYPAKIVNGRPAPEYGEAHTKEVWNDNIKDEFGRPTGKHGYETKPATSQTRLEIDGALLPEHDLFLHEIYRYLSNLYPDHPDWIELLTHTEIVDAFENAAAMVDYKPDDKFFQLVAQNMENVSSMNAASDSTKDEIAKEELKLLLRNLTNNSYRRKFYGASDGLKMFAAGVGELLSCFPVGEYLPHEPIQIKDDEISIKDPQDLKIDIFDPNFKKPFRIIDWTGNSRDLPQQKDDQFDLQYSTSPGNAKNLIEIHDLDDLDPRSSSSVGELTPRSSFKSPHNPDRVLYYSGIETSELKKLKQFNIKDNTTSQVALTPEIIQIKTSQPAPILYDTLTVYKKPFINSKITITNKDTKRIQETIIDDWRNLQPLVGTEEFEEESAKGIFAFYSMKTNNILHAVLEDQKNVEQFKFSIDARTNGLCLEPKYMLGLYGEGTIDEIIERCTSEKDRIAQDKLILSKDFPLHKDDLYSLDKITKDMPYQIFTYTGSNKGELKLKCYNAYKDGDPAPTAFGEFTPGTEVSYSTKHLYGAVINNSLDTKSIVIGSIEIVWDFSTAYIQPLSITFNIENIPSYLDDDLIKYLYDTETVEEAFYKATGKSVEETASELNKTSEEVLKEFKDNRNTFYTNFEFTDPEAENPIIYQDFTFGEGSQFDKIFEITYLSKEKFEYKDIPGIPNKGVIEDFNPGSNGFVSLFELKDDKNTFVNTFNKPSQLDKGIAITAESYKDFYELKPLELTFPEYESGSLYDKPINVLMPLPRTGIYKKENTAISNTKEVAFTLIGEDTWKHYKNTVSGPEHDLVVNTAQPVPIMIECERDTDSTNDLALATLIFKGVEEERKFETITTGDTVEGNGLPSGTYVVQKGKNEIILSNMIPKSGKHIYKFNCTVEAYPTDQRENFINYKKRLRDEGSLVDTSPFNNGLWGSNEWPHVSKAYIDGLVDPQDFDPINPVASAKYIYSDKLAKAKKAAEAATYNVDNIQMQVPLSSVSIGTKMFLELHINKLNKIPNHDTRTPGGVTPTLTNVEWLDYFDNNLKTITQASEATNIGVNLMMQTDTSGFYTRRQEANYTDDDLLLRFQTFGYNSETVPCYIQIGKGGTSYQKYFVSPSLVQKPTAYGASFFDTEHPDTEQIQKDLEKEGGAWNKRFVYSKKDIKSDKAASNLERIDDPVFELPLGEYDVQKHVKIETETTASGSAETDLDIVSATITKQEFRDLTKNIDEIKILNNSYTSYKVFDDSEGLEYAGEWVPQLSNNANEFRYELPENAKVGSYYTIINKKTDTVKGIKYDVSAMSIAYITGTEDNKDVSIFSPDFGGITFKMKDKMNGIEMIYEEVKSSKEGESSTYKPVFEKYNDWDYEFFRTSFAGFTVNRNFTTTSKNAPFKTLIANTEGKLITDIGSLGYKQLADNKVAIILKEGSSKDDPENIFEFTIKPKVDDGFELIDNTKKTYKYTTSNKIDIELFERYNTVMHAFSLTHGSNPGFFDFNEYENTVRKVFEKENNSSTNQLKGPLPIVALAELKTTDEKSYISLDYYILDGTQCNVPYSLPEQRLLYTGLYGASIIFDSHARQDELSFFDGTYKSAYILEQDLYTPREILSPFNSAIQGQNMIQLPRGFITDGSYGAELVIDPKFIASGIKLDVFEEIAEKYELTSTKGILGIDRFKIITNDEDKKVIQTWEGDKPTERTYIINVEASSITIDDELYIYEINTLNGIPTEDGLGHTYGYVSIILKNSKGQQYEYICNNESENSTGAILNDIIYYNISQSRIYYDNKNKYFYTFASLYKKENNKWVIDLSKGLIHKERIVFKEQKFFKDTYSFNCIYEKRINKESAKPEYVLKPIEGQTWNVSALSPEDRVLNYKAILLKKTPTFDNLLDPVVWSNQTSFEGEAIGIAGHINIIDFREFNKAYTVENKEIILAEKADGIDAVATTKPLNGELSVEDILQAFVEGTYNNCKSVNIIDEKLLQVNPLSDKSFEELYIINLEDNAIKVEFNPIFVDMNNMDLTISNLRNGADKIHESVAKFNNDVQNFSLDILPTGDTVFNIHDKETLDKILIKLNCTSYEDEVFIKYIKKSTVAKETTAYSHYILNTQNTQKNESNKILSEADDAKILYNTEAKKPLSSTTISSKIGDDDEYAFKYFKNNLVFEGKINTATASQINFEGMSHKDDILKIISPGDQVVECVCLDSQQIPIRKTLTVENTNFVPPSKVAYEDGYLVMAGIAAKNLYIYMKNIDLKNITKINFKETETVVIENICSESEAGTALVEDISLDMDKNFVISYSSNGEFRLKKINPRLQTKSRKLSIKQARSGLYNGSDEFFENYQTTNAKELQAKRIDGNAVTLVLYNEDKKVFDKIAANELTIASCDSKPHTVSRTLYFKSTTGKYDENTDFYTSSSFEEQTKVNKADLNAWSSLTKNPIANITENATQVSGTIFSVKEKWDDYNINNSPYKIEKGDIAPSNTRTYYTASKDYEALVTLDHVFIKTKNYNESKAYWRDNIVPSITSSNAEKEADTLIKDIPIQTLTAGTTKKDSDGNTIYIDCQNPAIKGILSLKQSIKDFSEEAAHITIQNNDLLNTTKKAVAERTGFYLTEKYREARSQIWRDTFKNSIPETFSETPDNNKGDETYNKEYTKRRDAYYSASKKAHISECTDDAKLETQKIHNDEIVNALTEQYKQKYQNEIVFNVPVYQCYTKNHGLKAKYKVVGKDGKEIEKETPANLPIKDIVGIGKTDSTKWGDGKDKVYYTDDKGLKYPISKNNKNEVFATNGLGAEIHKLIQNPGEKPNYELDDYVEVLEFDKEGNPLSLKLYPGQAPALQLTYPLEEGQPQPDPVYTWDGYSYLYPKSYWTQSITIYVQSNYDKYFNEHYTEEVTEKANELCKARYYLDDCKKAQDETVEKRYNDTITAADNKEANIRTTQYEACINLAKEDVNSESGEEWKNDSFSASDALAKELNVTYNGKNYNFIPWGGATKPNQIIAEVLRREYNPNFKENHLNVPDYLYKKAFDESSIERLTDYQLFLRDEVEFVTYTSYKWNKAEERYEEDIKNKNSYHHYLPLTFEQFTNSDIVKITPNAPKDPSYYTATILKGFNSTEEDGYELPIVCPTSDETKLAVGYTLGDTNAKIMKEFKLDTPEFKDQNLDSAMKQALYQEYSKYIMQYVVGVAFSPESLLVTSDVVGFNIAQDTENKHALALLTTERRVVSIDLKKVTKNSDISASPKDNFEPVIKELHHNTKFDYHTNSPVESGIIPLNTYTRGKDPTTMAQEVQSYFDITFKITNTMVNGPTFLVYGYFERADQLISHAVEPSDIEKMPFIKETTAPMVMYENVYNEKLELRSFKLKEISSSEVALPATGSKPYGIEDNTVTAITNLKNTFIITIGPRDAPTKYYPSGRTAIADSILMKTEAQLMAEDIVIPSYDTDKKANESQLAANGLFASGLNSDMLESQFGIDGADGLAGSQQVLVNKLLETIVFWNITGKGNGNETGLYGFEYIYSGGLNFTNDLPTVASIDSSTVKLSGGLLVPGDFSRDYNIRFLFSFDTRKQISNPYNYITLSEDYLKKGSEGEEVFKLSNIRREVGNKDIADAVYSYRETLSKAELRENDEGYLAQDEEGSEKAFDKITLKNKSSELIYLCDIEGNLLKNLPRAEDIGAETYNFIDSAAENDKSLKTTLMPKLINDAIVVDTMEFLRTDEEFKKLLKNISKIHFPKDEGNISELFSYICTNISPEDNNTVLSQLLKIPSKEAWDIYSRIAKENPESLAKIKKDQLIEENEDNEKFVRTLEIIESLSSFVATKEGNFGSGMNPYSNWTKRFELYTVNGINYVFDKKYETLLLDNIRYISSEVLLSYKSITPVRSVSLSECSIDDEGIIKPISSKGFVARGIYYPPKGYGSIATSSGEWTADNLPWINGDKKAFKEDTTLMNELKEKVWIVDQSQIPLANPDKIASLVPIVTSYNNLYDLGDTIDDTYKEVTYTGKEIMKFNSITDSEILLSKKIDIDNSTDEEMFEVPLTLRVLTKADTPVEENFQDKNNFVEVSKNEIKKFPPNRVYFVDQGLPLPPYYENGKYTHYKENTATYSLNKEYRNANNSKVYMCNADGQYITYINDKSNDTQIIDANKSYSNAGDELINPPTPLFNTCEDWFKSAFYVKGDESNPFWQVIKIYPEFDISSKQFVSKSKIFQYQKTLNRMNLVEVFDKSQIYINMKSPTLRRVIGDKTVVTPNASFIDLDLGQINFTLEQPGESFRGTKEAVRYGISYYNSFFSPESSDTSTPGINAGIWQVPKDEIERGHIGIITAESLLKVGYIVNSLEDIADPENTDSGITWISEVGLFDQFHKLVAYATFPPIEYRSDKQHVSFTCFINHTDCNDYRIIN